MHNDQPLETKVAGHGYGDPLSDVMRTLEAFKEANDTRLAEIERRMSPDVVTTERLARIEGALDDSRRRFDQLSVRQARPDLGPGAALASDAVRERKANFEAYVRRGEVRPTATYASGPSDAKAMSVGSGPDGGFVVPPETETVVNRSLRDISPIRSIAEVRQVSGSVFNKPFVVADAVAGWVAETAARTQTNAPTLASLAFPTMELYAMPAATQALLDDAVVDLDAWLADEVRGAFAAQEGTAFVTGDGTAKPRGFLAYPQVADATWSWGNIGTISTGVAGAFAATSPGDKLVDLTFTVKAGYRANGSFVMNRATLSVIRKMKDTAGDYYWLPAQRPGEPSLLMGYPVVESEDMPSIAANSTSVAFGDFRRGYLVVDRVGIRVLRDPYSAKPYVLFYTTKRVGGGVQDFAAIKLLKFGV